MSDILLDTHVFLWLVGEPARLSPTTHAMLGSPSTTLLLSMASVWEMAIKQTLGKLILPEPPAPPESLADFLIPRLSAHRIHLLDIELAHIFRMQTLPPRHKDPFDRLIIAQALEKKCTLISHDNVVQAYNQDGLAVVW